MIGEDTLIHFSGVAMGTLLLGQWRRTCGGRFPRPI